MNDFMFSHETPLFFFLSRSLPVASRVAKIRSVKHHAF